MRFSEMFQLKGNQAQFDFVDVPLRRDIRLFIDPFGIATTATAWCEEWHVLVSDFFQNVLDALRSGDRNRAISLLAHLKEDNRTRMGYSVNEPKGSCFGDGKKAREFVDALEASEAFKTGHITDLEDTALFVEGVGIDNVSDIVGNVLREKLADYTREQCTLCGITMETADEFLAWRAGEGWVSIKTQLPSDSKGTILLVPRSLVRRALTLQPEQYLGDFIDEYDRGSVNAIRSLEKLLQNVPKKKNNKASRKGLRDNLKPLGSVKNIMSRLTGEHPDALKGYKKRSYRKHPMLSPAEIERLHPEPKNVDLAEVVAEMHSAAANSSDVGTAIRAIIRAVVASLHPTLQHPHNFDVGVDFLAGVVMDNMAGAGPWLNGQKRHAGPPHRNILILTTLNKVDHDFLTRLNSEELMKRADAGSIMLVGNEIDQPLLKGRKKIAKAGVFITTTADLAAIAELERGPEIALGAIYALYAR